ILWRMPADLSPGRIGIMFARLDDLPAAPALDGATSPLTTDGISGPIYGTKEFPVAGGRVGAMLFRAGGPDWRSACGNCGNWRFPPVAGNIGCPRPATRVSASNVSQHLLRPEMRAQHGGRLVVGLEPLLQEAGERKEAVDRTGIVDVGRLDAGLDQPVGIG